MIPKAQFGRTGHGSTRVIFGGWALARVDRDTADRTIERMLEFGINHIDTAADYGESEVHLGRWMSQIRPDVFLATKTSARTYGEARDSLYRSLGRLRVDYVDLFQLHNLVDPIEWNHALRDGGVLDAAIEAREEGLIRFIGVTGHGSSVPAMHLRSLERFDFDAVLLPFDYMMMTHPKYADDFSRLLEVCQERGIAVQTIKSIARRRWVARDRSYNTWYEPLLEQADVDRAVHWVLERPDVFLNSVGDVNLFPKVAGAASRLRPAPTDEEMRRWAVNLEMEPLFA